jgi:2'-5' RNA ligase
MSRYVVVLPLTPMTAGDSFLTRDWPLHVTLVPVFESAAEPPQLGSCLAAVAASADPFTVIARQDEAFGPSHTIPVTVVESTADLDALHAACVAALDHLDPAYENPEYMSEGYRPHVTVKRHGRVDAGDHLHLRQIALVDMQPGQRAGGREVLAVAALGQSTRAVVTAQPPG